SAPDHPNICSLYDVGEQGGRVYLVMPCLEGTTLAARLSTAALPLDQALRIAIEICDALDRAHRHGIVHRDLKPGNIMLTKAGAKLLDFGLAKRGGVVSPAAEVTLASAAVTSPGGGSGPLTAKGTILGTFHYMAPEQLRGEEADGRSDLYALGAVIYEMVSGQRPFDAADTATLIAAILEREPRPLSGATGLPPRLDLAVRACLEKDPADRWQSARDLLRELRWIADESNHPAAVRPAAPVPAGRRVSRRAWMVGCAIAAVAALGGVAGWARFGAAPVPSTSGTPVIVMMDSPHPARVYDPATLKAGGTNADDLTDLLRDLPVELVKETSSTSWHREDQVLRENPALILVHRSCFYDATLLGDPALDNRYAGVIYPHAADKLEVLLGYIALGNPRTRFVVYSRGSWATEAVKDAWVSAMTQRFPRLKGRIVAYKVPLDRATFRDPQTGAEIKAIVSNQLATLARRDETR
ncbi:MAG: serine/threonine-protein kinase, partial [Acidobacteria bacterium]|nr:serine/threonine-protein kinase [Acidobacteriota bacterium]